MATLTIDLPTYILLLENSHSDQNAVTILITYHVGINLSLKNIFDVFSGTELRFLGGRNINIDE